MGSCLAPAAPLAAGELPLWLDLWRLDCSSVQPQDLAQAAKEAARLLKPCGIRVQFRDRGEIRAKPAWCELPASEEARRPLLEAFSLGPRKRHPQGLSLFCLPGGSQARYSWSVIDRSRAAGCGTPSEARYLPRFGSLYMTDFAFHSEDPSPGLLLAHEIAHALTQRGHPTRAARGGLLADHFADLGPVLDPSLCDCMRQSPYLRP